jgi:hypothetical protein
MIVDNPDPIGKSLENQKYRLCTLYIFCLTGKFLKCSQKTSKKEDTRETMEDIIKHTNGLTFSKDKMAIDNSHDNLHFRCEDQL